MRSFDVIILMEIIEKLSFCIVHVMDFMFICSMAFEVLIHTSISDLNILKGWHY